MNNHWCKLEEKWKLGEKRIFVRAKYLGYGGDKLRKLLLSLWNKKWGHLFRLRGSRWGQTYSDAPERGSQLWCTLESPKGTFTLCIWRPNIWLFKLESLRGRIQESVFLKALQMFPLCKCGWQLLKGFTYLYKGR